MPGLCVALDDRSTVEPKELGRWLRCEGMLTGRRLRHDHLFRIVIPLDEDWYRDGEDRNGGGNYTPTTAAGSG
jgi:hypothetical protein